MYPKIYVMTSDKYLPALKPFSYLINKYWVPNPEIFVAGYSLPKFALPDNFRFISLGDQSDYPFNRWSDALYKFLTIMEDESFVLMLEDYWVVRPVDTRAIEILNDYARQFGYVLKVDICADRLHAYGSDLNYGTVSYLDLIKSMPGSPYHMSLWPGIWRRDNLFKCIIPNESPHDMEIIGTTRVSHMQDMIVLGTHQVPLRIALGLRGGDHTRINLSEIKREDVDDMKRLKLLDSWDSTQDGIN